MRMTGSCQSGRQTSGAGRENSETTNAITVVWAINVDDQLQEWR